MCEGSRNAKRQKIRASQRGADASVRHGKVLRNAVDARGRAPRRAPAATDGGVPVCRTRAGTPPATATGAAVRRLPAPTLPEGAPVAP